MIIQKKSHINLPLPDGEKSGLSNQMRVHSSAKAVKDVSVAVDIKHSWPEDLVIKLTAPNGKTATLLKKGEAHGQGLKRTFSGDMMKPVLGGDGTGIWDLRVIDYSKGGKGVLKNWNLKIDCDSGGRGSEVFINPNKDKGARSIQLCRFNGRVTDISATVDITHYSIQQLQVSLVSPSGKTVVLHNETGGNKGRLQKTYSKSALADMIGEKTNGQWKLVVKDMKGHPSGQINHWKVNMTYSAKDDLKKVEGIGPKIESLLNDAGIHSFARLSGSSADYIKQILRNAGDRFAMHDPTTWAKQAEMADKGLWERLEKWQDKLDGGRA